MPTRDACPYVLDEKKQKRYTVNDLDKKYGLQRPKEIGRAKSIHELKREDADTIETAVKLARMEEQLKALEEENRRLRQTEERLWQRPQQLTGRLLAAPPAEPRADAAPPPKKSLWQRIIGA